MSRPDRIARLLRPSERERGASGLPPRASERERGASAWPSRSAEAATRAELAIEAARHGQGGPDWLLRSLMETLEADGRVIAPSEGVRAWCRAVGAAIERQAPRRGVA